MGVWDSQSWALAAINRYFKFLSDEKGYFCIFCSVNLIEGRLFNRPGPEIGYFLVILALKVTFFYHIAVPQTPNAQLCLGDRTLDDDLWPASSRPCSVQRSVSFWPPN